jgi:hypothetical protein
MDQILGWGTAGGLGVLLAGLGGFFWRLQFVRGKYWRHGRWASEEKSEKKEDSLYRAIILGK